MLKKFNESYISSDLQFFFFLFKAGDSWPIISGLDDLELEQMENMRRRLHQLAAVILIATLYK